jgi:hypothetical protein
MKITPMHGARMRGWLVLAASIALAACAGGANTPTTVNEAVASSSTASAYTGPAPATADVQAFAVNFWANVRAQNRCGQCHNSTSPAQMPNFARSDDVNLAYAQANSVVNLKQPSTSTIVAKVSGGHNCWLADPGACGTILTTWITNWAGATGAGGTGTQIQLVAPPVQTVGQSKNFPAAPADFQATVYPLLSTYCSKCHSPNASTPQSPYFASPDVNQAYQSAIPKMDLNTPTNSRFYERLLNENHNCWSNCAANAATMLAAIEQFAGMVPLTSIDPSLVVSKALTLAQGTVASGSGRYDSAVIAEYLFETGTGLTAYDTSGVDPAADLTISGSVTWAGGWGINVGAGGKAQASTSSSQKFTSMIQATGEYSVEAWVAPALVAVDKSYMVSYSGGDATRNFTLGQTDQQYDFLMRSSNSDLNGMPQLQTPLAANLLQASLQHVVLTYDPVNGRQIYVNGVNAKVPDPEKGGTIANWDSTFALVLGNEVSGDRSWQGLIKFVAIHNRALTAAQVLQNYNAGVGQRYYVLFNVADLTGVSQGYVMFTASQYDSASYLFTAPTFVSLDPTVTPNNIVIKGIRIGINGTLPTVGQAYIPLDTTVTAANYKFGGEVLSQVGTVIPIQSGPLTDQFFLSFDQLGTATHATVEATPVAAAPADIPLVADVGVRTFAEINSSLASLSGVSANPTAVSTADMQTITTTYAAVQQQLPANPTLEGFSAGNQVGIAQLAVAYCNAMVDTPAIAAQVLPGVTFNASLYQSQAGIDSVTGALAARVLGVNLQSQPAASTMTGASTGPGTGELDNLIGTLCSGKAPCTSTARVQAVTVAACAAAFGSADMLIN